jgi:hypothetical protein
VVEVVAVVVVVVELFVVVDAVEAQEWSLQLLDDTGPCLHLLCTHPLCAVQHWSLLLYGEVPQRRVSLMTMRNQYRGSSQP